MISGTLTIPISIDKVFRKHCKTHTVNYRCILEGEISNKYLIEFELVCDLYHLGQAMGIELFDRAQQEEKQKLKT